MHARLGDGEICGGGGIETGGSVELFVETQKKPKMMTWPRIENSSHIKDKLVQMSHLNETIYATGIASSYQGFKTKSGWFMDDREGVICNYEGK